MDADPTIWAMLDRLLDTHGVNQLKLRTEVLIAFIHNISDMLFQEVFGLEQQAADVAFARYLRLNAHELQR